MTGPRLFVDVGCVRVQRYLARTTRLRGRRGASDALTAAARIPDGVLPHYARRHGEGGEVDGVAHLVVDRPPEAGEASQAIAEEVAGAAFAHLRELLPAIELEASWGIGNSYVEAYDSGIGPRRAHGDAIADLPPPAEVGYGARCELCHVDPACRTMRLARDGDKPGDPPPEPVRACPDCAMRFSREMADGRTAREGRLMAVTVNTEPPGSLTRIAALGPLGRPGSPNEPGNHVAVVFADGNAFGDFFTWLARNGRLETKPRISRTLNQATQEALQEATFAISEDADGGLLPVVPHIVGGDDVLVSVPAARAWAFTRSLLHKFEQEANCACNSKDAPLLSASAGLAFVKHNSSFHSAVDAAEERLRHAKWRRQTTTEQHPGEIASGTVASVDLTTGETTESVPVGMLMELAPLLDKFAAIPGSHRRRLAETLSDEHAYALADRVGHGEVVRRVGKAWPGGLRDAVAMTRWWR